MARPPTRGRPAMTKPPTRGGRSQGQPPAGAATARRHDRLSTARYQRPGRKVLLAHNETAGAMPVRGQPIEGRRPHKRYLQARRQP
ncbi:hypothetical protein B296_00000160 [Ensete ventricosum]|uniref:Uncharacterized protein n=1 Tax=Ensete ventricosum TaxID=4639 RepID=A0A426YPR2_ENSVE|nr:hypothetical protein B296_00000160 [Ensete ventricosum]